jgi:hypothetical protein
MTCEHVAALHVSSGGCPSDSLNFGNPSPLEWESTRVMARAWCHSSLDPALSKKRKLIENVRIPLVFDESHVMLI